MRKIEKMMIKAVNSKKGFTLDNTTVEYLPALDTPTHARIEYSKIFLHGHHIASYDYARGEYTPNLMTLAAWPSRTTKSRLRALGLNVSTRKGVTYYNDKAVA